MTIQNLIGILQTIHNIISKNKILTLIKGHNPVKNYQKKKNKTLHLVNINAYTKLDQLLSIHSQDIEQKHNFDINQGP